MSIVEIDNYEFKGYHLVYDKNEWKIEELNQSFKTSQAAEKHIVDRLKESNNSQSKAISDSEKNMYSLNIAFPNGTKERMSALNLKKTNSEFVRDIVLQKLEELEKLLK